MDVNKQSPSVGTCKIWNPSPVSN